MAKKSPTSGKIITTNPNKYPNNNNNNAKSARCSPAIKSPERGHSPNHPNGTSSSPRTSPGLLAGHYAGCKFSEPPLPSALPLPPQHWMQQPNCNTSMTLSPSIKHHPEMDIAHQLKILLKVQAWLIRGQPFYCTETFIFIYTFTIWWEENIRMEWTKRETKSKKIIYYVIFWRICVWCVNERMLCDEFLYERLVIFKSDSVLSEIHFGSDEWTRQYDKQHSSSFDQFDAISARWRSFVWFLYQENAYSLITNTYIYYIVLFSRTVIYIKNVTEKFVIVPN